MKQFSLATLSPLPLSVIAAACGGLDSSNHATLPPGTSFPPPSAGNVGMGIAADRDPAAIAKLRAGGPAALAELLATYDRTEAGRARAALAATIDQVAAQRYATVSRLYWYTDLATAEAESKATGKPILSLRMLGRLDEDLSCANSRFFRTILYPDPAISALLRDKFVLHWSSERAVPRVTIDFGDGRTIERTVTGNSVHYVLDADGNVVDALPGLYAPAVFKAELDQSLGLYNQLARAGEDEREGILADYHHGRIAELDDRWSKLAGTIVYNYGTDRVLLGDMKDSALARAQRSTMSKARVEVPQLAQIDIGSDPTALMPDVTTWAVIGQALFGLLPSPTAPAQPEELSLEAYNPTPTIKARRKNAMAAPATADLGLLSAPARELIAQVMRGSAGDVARVIPELERTLIADTAINELQLRRQISELLGAMADHSFAAVNTFVYTEVFATPADDSWLGLVSDDVFSGLPADGIVIAR